MMKTRWGVVVIAGALTLAGCGGGVSSASSSTPRAADVAKSAGCTGYKDEGSQMYTQEMGVCQINGADVYVMTFRDQASRDNWMKVAPAGGGSFGEGDLWVLQSDNRDAVVKGTKAAHGKMV